MNPLSSSNALFKVFFILMLLLVPSLIISSLQATKLQESNSNKFLEQSGFYLEKDHQASIDDIQNRDFIPFNQAIALGFQFHPIWVALKVKPQRDPKTLSIRIAPSVIDKIELFEPQEDGWKRRVTGDTLPKNFREVADSNFHFLITPDINEPKTYYIKVTTTSLSNLSIKVEDMAGIIPANKTADMIDGMNLGALIIFMLITIIACTLQRSGFTISLLIYAITSITFVLSHNGFILQLLPDHASPLNDLIYKCFLIAKLAINHTLSYFLIKKIDGPRWYLSMAWINIPIFVIAFAYAGSPYYLQIIFYLIKFSMCMQLIHLIAAWQSKDQEIRISVFFGYLTILLIAGLFQSNLILHSNFISATQLVGINTSITGIVFLGIYLKLTLRERRNSLLMRQQITGHQENIKANGMLFDMLSHEIKNAISTITLGAESLRESIDDDDDDDDAKLKRKNALKKRTSNIKLSADNIASILSRCLRLNEIEDGRVRIHPISLNLGEMLREVTQDMAERNQLNNIEVQVNLDQTIRLNKDYFLFKLMLSNLIENACKYAVKGSTVVVNVKKEGAASNDVISIQVINATSVGFPDEERLFERYYRSEHAHQFPGSGLGLILVKKLSQLFEGDITYSRDASHVIFTVEVKA